MKVTKRDDTGKPIKPSIPNDADTNADAPARVETAAILDETQSPDVPIKDLKIESFLMQIVEQAITGTDNLFRIY